ncbi:hypothetical protein ONZ45_g2079 [Pleurotus djamor]|nr:hypothetical protein ONZ45_g2079 [Pleurotus djamor]
MSHTESSALKHLIIVPGHSIWRGASAADRLNEDDWILEPYQRGGGRVAAFYDHIAKGVELAVNDPQALLVFSGGQTRPGSTTTEGESYLRLALSANLFKMPSSQPHFPRATTEDFALDSFQNLLFSVARFHEFTGRYPESITVVGFHYIGADPLGDEAAQAQEGEKKNGYLPYSQDLYGCHSYLLSKRRQRNPFLRFHPYHSSAPELADLLDWCPDAPVMTFSGSLPWSS